MVRMAILVMAVLAQACGGNEQSIQPTTVEPTTTQPTTTQQPTTQPTTTQTTTAQPPDSSATPSATDEPTSTQPPLEPAAPLPDPALQSIDQVVEVMFERAQAEQVVVSMLDQLDIGLYNEDGTPIRTGAEASDTDLYLYEPEARGLVAMARKNTDVESWIPFRDFHAALANLGFQGSAEELAGAYASAYEADFDAPISKLVYALAGVDVDAPLPPFAMWLMLVDGFVPPSEGGGGAQLALTGPFAGSSSAGWGVAQPNVQQISPLPLEADPLVIAHLMAVVSSASVNVSATPAKAHEGHGASGSPVTITANVRATAGFFISPFSLRPLIPSNPTGGANLPVTWTVHPSLQDHGTVPLAPSVTDPLGQARLTYTPNQEDANGEGYLANAIGTVQASVDGAQLINQAYGVPTLGALVGRQVFGLTLLEVEWHEPEAMRISLVNTYDVTLDLILATGHASGTDRFEGILALQEDGTWRGVVNGSASGSHQTQAFGERCSSSWSASQLVEVVGAEAPFALNGDFYFEFHPVTAPSGSLGSGKCPPTVGSYEGVDYAPYNDYNVSQAAEHQGLVIILPQQPGGTRDYPVHLAGVVDANWRVEIEFLEPQP